VDEFPDIFQCPVTGKALRQRSARELATEDNIAYPVAGGIAGLLPPTEDGDPSQSIKDFYQSVGWETDDQGVFTDTKSFVDTRAISLAFTDRCVARLNRYFRGGGEYLLDAGSGPVSHDGVLAYGTRFAKRVCVDLSIQGLRAAQRKLGDRGVYLQGDLTRLPLRDATIDAITCNHVLYQAPAEKQAAALLEMWRVLKPGGVAVIVYLSPYAPLEKRLVTLARVTTGGGPGPIAATPDQPTLYHHAYPVSWFEAPHWPFRCEVDAFRVLGQGFMREHVGDNWRGRLFLNFVYALQVLAPRFCGRYGAIPAIVLRKPPSSPVPQPT